MTKGEQPLVSVIMLTYNQEKYIVQAVKSVLSQETLFPIELLIGDDCSDDDTASVLEPYLSQYPQTIKFFRRQENMGASRNAFDLLLRSHGKYLAFCEGDDYWIDKKKLQKQIDFLETHPEFIGCTHRCLLVDEKGKVRRRQHLSWVKYKQCFRFDDFEGGKYLPGQTATVVKRNLFCNSKDDWSILYCSNRDISDRVANMVYLLRGDFSFLDETMSAYRQVSQHGGGNATSRLFKDNENKCQDEMNMTQVMEDYASKYLNRPVRFSRKHSDILLDSLIELVRHPDKKHLYVVKDMLKLCNNVERLSLFRSFVEKAINRFI